MKPIVNACMESIQLWLCLAVYVWALEFQAVIGLDQEPLFDRLKDCAAVLLTLALWAAIAGLTLVTPAILLRISDVALINRLFCKGVAVIATAFYFFRWLDNWPFSETHPQVVTAILFLIWSSLGSWFLLYRLGKAKLPKAINLPSLKDCFWFGAVPILVCAGTLVGVQIVGSAVAYPRVPTTMTALTGAGGRNIASKPNVIVIVLDGLRARSMSLYGYHRKTTPFLEDFANRSAVFMQAHTNSTSTLVSITTLFTGKHPLTHGRSTKYQSQYASTENLLNVMKENGYTTSAVTSNVEASLHTAGFAASLSHPEVSNFQLDSLHSLSAFGIRNTNTGLRFYKGLTMILKLFGFPEPGYAYGGADSTTQIARSLVSTMTSPFFLFVHLHEPHYPYFAPAPFRGQFLSREDQRYREKSPTPAVYATYDMEHQPVVDTYRNEYDETIAWSDSELGIFIKSLENLRHMDNTLVIITSDHGESFERGYFGHGEELYESSTHVPLIIRWPRQKQGMRISGHVQTMDIAPTVLKALDIPIPSWMDGQVIGLTRERGIGSTVAVNFKFPRGKTIHTLPTKLAVWQGPHKAIFDCETRQAELYDLSADADETINLASQNGAVLRELRERLRASLVSDSGRGLLACSTDH